MGCAMAEAESDLLSGCYRYYQHDNVCGLCCLVAYYIHLEAVSQLKSQVNLHV